jgi:hypothetical protein
MEKNNKHWTDEDIQYLKENYSIADIDELANRLERSVDSVRWQASNLKLTSDRNYWSKEEVLFIAQYCTSLTYQEMADKLGRTARSVAHKVHNLKIAKLIDQAPTNLDAIEDGVPYYKGKSGEYRVLLSRLGISQSFVYPSEDRQTVQNQINHFTDKVFRTKAEDEKTRRVWRLL